MRILRLVILLFSIGITPTIAQQLGYINDNDGFTNLRLEPSGESDIIGIIITGQEFKYYSDKSSDWWKIDFKYRTGFMHKSRIKDFDKVETEVGQFFQEFYSTDRNNAELGEGNNEKLFLLTQDYPLATLTAFCEQRKEIQAFLISEYESPIHDLIDLQLIYSRLISIKSPCSETYKITDALKTAAHNVGLKLKNSKIDYTDLPAENNPKMNGLLTNKFFTAKIDNKPITFYLNHPAIDKYSKMYYQGQFKLYDNNETFAFLDSVMTDNEIIRPFYFYIFNSVLSQSDGALSEYIAGNCLDFFSKYPCDYFRFYDTKEYKVNQPNWIGFIGWQLYEKTEYDKFVSKTNVQIENTCPTYLRKWTDMKEKVKDNLEE